MHSLVDFYQSFKILGMSTSKYMDTSLCYKVKANIFYFKIPILFLWETKNSWRSNKEKIYQGQGTFESWNKESGVESTTFLGTCLFPATITLLQNLFFLKCFKFQKNYILKSDAKWWPQKIHPNVCLVNKVNSFTKSCWHFHQ